ncbi:MAG: hypothetical protein HC880_13310 [Bacteroidia bacterium]|nr:hypothetical protein [Bacteroidia bacterium]
MSNQVSNQVLIEYLQQLAQQNLRQAVEVLKELLSPRTDARSLYQDLLQHAGILYGIQEEIDQGTLTREEGRALINARRPPFLRLTEKLAKLAPIPFNPPDKLPTTNMDFLTDFRQHREQDLLDHLKTTYELLRKWEKKWQLAENPNEEMRSKAEVERQKEIIENHLVELALLRQTVISDSFRIAVQFELQQPSGSGNKPS